MKTFKTLYESQNKPLTGFAANKEALPFIKIPLASCKFDNGISAPFTKSKVPLISDYMLFSFKLEYDDYFFLDIRIDSTDPDIKPSENTNIQSGFVEMIKKAGFEQLTTKSADGRVIIRAKDLGKDPGKNLIKLAKYFTPTALDKIFASVYGKDQPMKVLLPKMIKSAKLKATEKSMGVRSKYIVDKGDVEQEFIKFKNYMTSEKYESNSNGSTFKTWLVGYGRYVSAKLVNGVLEITHYS